MRIQNIKVKNFQGIANLSLPVESPVLFVAGHNGAGKSSLRDAVRIALTGEASRVTLKKDYKAMIKDGTKKAEIAIATDDGTYQFSLPQAKGVHSDSEYLPLCVDSTAFCNMKPDERRKALFDLTGCEVSTKKVREMLLAEGCDQDMTEQILPMLRSGFPAAEKEAKERASQARGSWKAVTGETYGKQKAEGWEPSEELATPEHSAKAIQDQLSANRVTLDNLHQMLGKGRVVSQRAERLKELVGQSERIKTKQETDQATLERTQRQLERYEAKRLYDSAMTCPCCSNKLVLQDGALIDAQHYAGAEFTEADSGTLEELRNSVSMMQRTIQNNQRDLDAATSAQSELDALIKENGGEISDKALAGFQSNIDELEVQNQKLQSSLAEQQASEARYQQSLKAAEEAARYHNEVTQWVQIAELMAPEGIPANILSQAMKPLQTLVNNINSLTPNWPDVSINQDMELMSDSRLYGLLSESEQWRVQTIMALALAQLSGINLAVLDRIDVLDPSSRIDLVEMLLALTEQNAELQVFMLGTLAKPAIGMPESIQHVWIEHGEVTDERASQAA